MDNFNKKAWYLKAILGRCNAPLRMSELTNPEKPSDPEQKYWITGAGKAFLGALS